MANPKSAVELSYFVHADDERLSRPWSRGDFTFASNGHVMIRMPPQAGVKSNAAAPDPSAILDSLDFSGCDRSMPRLPPLRFVWVPDEPTDVTDETTDNSGALELWRETATIRGAIFDLRYLHLLTYLPDLRLGRGRDPLKPLPFTFSGGGLGGLMPCRSPLKYHYNLDNEPLP